MTTTQEFTLEQAVAAIRVLVLQVNDQGDDVPAGGKWADALLALVDGGDGPDLDVLVGLYNTLDYLEDAEGRDVPTREDRRAAVRTWIGPATPDEMAGVRRWQAAVEAADRADNEGAARQQR